MLKIILGRITSRPLISAGIILLTLSLSFFLGILNMVYYSFANEQSVIAKRHYGDIVITAFLKEDGSELKGKSEAQTVLTEQLRDSELPTFIDVMGFSKPAIYSSSEYAATYIPYRSKILPYLESSEWYEASIGRHLRAEWFYGGGSILVLDEAENNIMLGDVAGVDFNELIEFDYSFKDSGIEIETLPQHGIFLSEALYRRAVQELGREIEYGERLKIGYPSFGIDNPRLISYFYLDFLGVIPDTGGRLNNGSEARSDVVTAYIDPVSMVRLFQLDKTFSPSANGDRVTLKKLTADSEALKFTRVKMSGGYLYDPNQISIRIKDGYKVDAVIEEIQAFLDENVNTSYSRGTFRALPAYEYLGYGSAGTSIDEYIAMYKEKISLISLVIVVASIIILFELLYGQYVGEQQTIMFIRTLGASRSTVWKYYMLELIPCMFIPFIIGLLAGTAAGFPASNSIVGIALCSVPEILLLVLLALLLLALAALLMTLMSTGRRRGLKGGDGLW